MIADGWRCFVSRVLFGEGWLRGGGGGCMECVLSVSQVLYHVNPGLVLHEAL